MCNESPPQKRKNQQPTGTSHDQHDQNQQEQNQELTALLEECEKELANLAWNKDEVVKNLERHLSN